MITCKNGHDLAIPENVYTYSRKGRVSRRCRRCHNKKYGDSRKKLDRELREKVIALLGDKCARCGFDDIRALQVDHVHGGGYKEVKAIGPRGVYRRVLFHTSDYQCLCANCNWIKRAEQREQGGKQQKR
jgi:hypothetical protein